MIPLKKKESHDLAPEGLVLYGPPKIGKTELVAQLEDWLLLDFERGSNHVSAMKQKIVGFYPPKESEVMKKERLERDELYFREFEVEFIRYIKEHGNPYKGVVIDTVTEIEEWCEADATWEYMGMLKGKSYNRISGKSGLDDNGNIINVVPKDQFKSVLNLPKGAGYLPLRESFKKWKGKFDKIAPHKIYIAHVKDIFLEKRGREVSAKDLDLTGKIKQITCSKVDAIGLLYRDSENPLELRISFRNLGEDLSGSRAKHLRNQDFVIAENNPDGSIKKHYWDKIYI